MKRHHLQQNVDREVNWILTITPVRPPEQNPAFQEVATQQRMEATRDAADAAAARGDYLAAAGLWERAFLRVLSKDIYFSDPWANLVVPAMVHKTRARGLIQAGQMDAAMKEARLTLHLVPADADALIELVYGSTNPATNPKPMLSIRSRRASIESLSATTPTAARATTNSPGHRSCAIATWMTRWKMPNVPSIWNPPARPASTHSPKSISPAGMPPTPSRR